MVQRSIKDIINLNEKTITKNNITEHKPLFGQLSELRFYEANAYLAHHYALLYDDHSASRRLVNVQCLLNE